MEVAKALGGSFKLVTLAPKTVREMTQLLRETQKDGDTQTNFPGTVRTPVTVLPLIYLNAAASGLLEKNVFRLEITVNETIAKQQIKTQ